MPGNTPGDIITIYFMIHSFVQEQRIFKSMQKADRSIRIEAIIFLPDLQDSGNKMPQA